MKYSVAVFFILFSLYGLSQPVWKCVYSDSATMWVPDSVMPGLVADMKEKNIPDEVIEAMIEAIMLKLKAAPASTTRIRHITANADSTMISMEVLEEGSLRLDAFTSGYFLLKRNELYIMTGSGNYDSLVTTPRKVFKSSGRQPVFFNHTCREYISADSTCVIWVAEELPSCINPGIRTGDIKGAVLFFELKSAGGLLVRCGVTKIEQEDKKKIGL